MHTEEPPGKCENIDSWDRVDVEDNVDAIYATSVRAFGVD
jgi:hypothetical protein